MVSTTAHDVVHHDAKAATCTEKGWYAYDTCNKCRYTTYAEISALGHDKVSHDGKAATCTESGYQPYETCSRCDYTTYETIDALGHDTVSHTGKAATCTEDGYQPYETCSRCDFTTYKTVGALGHDIVSHAGKGATCTEDGAQPYEACSRCDYTTYEKIPARGHDRIPHDAKAATCTEIGWGVYVTCNRCRYTTYREIAALGHDEIPHAGKVATCTEGGYQPYVTCSRCDYTTCKKVDALGHDFTGGTWQSDAAGHWKRCSRCEVAGEKENHTGGTATCQGGAVCDVCFGVYGERNPGRHIGGTEIRDMREATAEKAGYTGNRYCKGCHVKLSDGTGIPTLSELSVDKKSDLASAADAMEKFWNDQSDALTDEQEKQLADSIRAVRSALESIKNVEEAVKKAEAMPASDKILPDDEAAMVAYETAKKAYDALSAEEKEMAGERTGNALDAMQKALTAYDVTYGNGNTWTENEKDDGLTFTVNGSHKKFADLIINGAVVNREYYDIGQGSTIITLKAPYLQSLPAGTYTLLVRYTDGSTDGEDTFTITKNDPANPSDPTVTDHPVPVVWIGMVIACVVIIFLLLLLLFRKRKQEEDR